MMLRHGCFAYASTSGSNEINKVQVIKLLTIYKFVSSFSCLILI